MWGIWLVNVAQLHTLLGGCYMSLCYNDNMRLILLRFVFVLFKNRKNQIPRHLFLL